MNIKLMEKYLAVKVEDTNTTKSGIILADTTTREKPQQGTITHVGLMREEAFPQYMYVESKDPGQIASNIKKIEPETIFEVGQVILFEKYGAIELKVNDETLHVIDKRDVIGILE
jgi:chaperonin GroES